MLVLPKYLVLTNQYLLRMYYIGLIITAFFMVFQFWYLEQGVLKLSMAGKAQVSLWAGSQGREAINQIWENARSLSICRDRRILDYWYDPDEDDLKYENHSCLPPCGMHANVAEGDACFNTADTHLQETQDQVFLVTRKEEQKFAPDGSDIGRSSYILPTVEALQVSFAYALEVEMDRWWYRGSGVGQDREAYSTYSRKGGKVLTVILNSNGSVFHKYKPGEFIKLAVSQLLSLAGSRTMLDEEQTLMGPNMKEDAVYKSGPLGRISGLQLNLHLDCYNHGQMGEAWEGPACYVTFVQDKIWAEHRHFDHKDGRRLKYSGIRIKVTTGGYWALLDFRSMLLNLVAALVLLQIPRKIVLYFAVSCLGKLSEVYDRIIFEEVHIGKEICAMSARIIEASCTFMELQKVEGQTGLSKVFLRKRIEHITKNSATRPEISAGVGVDMFTDFAWKAMNEPDWFLSYEDTTRALRFLYSVPCARSFAKAVAWCVGLRTIFRRPSDTTVNHVESKDNLELDEFLEAISAREPIGFYVLTRFFGVQEKRSFLERIFMPHYLREFLEKDELRRKSVICGDANTDILDYSKGGEEVSDSGKDANLEKDVATQGSERSASEESSVSI